MSPDRCAPEVTFTTRAPFAARERDISQRTFAAMRTQFALPLCGSPLRAGVDCTGPPQFSTIAVCTTYTNDVLSNRVAEISSIGQQDVYTIAVAGT